MRKPTLSTLPLTSLMCGVSLALAGCAGDDGTDGVIEGEGYDEPYDSTGEAVPADAPGRAVTDEPDGTASQTDTAPTVGAGAVPSEVIGSGAEPGQPISDADVDVSNRASE